MTGNARRAARGTAGARRRPRRGHRPDRRPRPAQRLPAGRASALRRPPTLRAATRASSRRWPWRRWSATCGRCSSCASAARSCSTTATTSAPTPPAGGVPEALDHRHLHRALPAPAVLPRDRAVSLDLPVGRGRRPRRRSTSSAWSCSPTSSGSPTGSSSRARTWSARGCRPGSPGSATASAPGSALAVNEAVADGRLRAPVAFTRDHMDCGAMTHPNIITEAMADGSDAVSDWPLLNALLTTAAGADLVALHAGGGGYAGYSQSAGHDRRRHRKRRTPPRGCAARCNVDTAIGVLRHADAGYEDARSRARASTACGLEAGREGARSARRPRGRRRRLGAGRRRRRLGRPRAAGRHHRGAVRHARGWPRSTRSTPTRCSPPCRAIGAPAAVGWEMRPGDYVRALELLMEAVAEPIVGTVTAQNGSSTTCNGWVASAVLGTLVIDAAGDGRAHPTGKMGSFGLAADDDYQTVQAVAGGNRAENRYLEVVTRGTRPPHRERAAHRRRPVGRVHLLRPQPAAGLVRRRARRRRRDQLRARRSARRSWPPSRRGPQADDRGDRRAPRRRDARRAARCAAESCGPRTRSTSARCRSASSSSASSTST